MTSEIEVLAPWAVDEAGFPARRSAADKLLFLINYAVLAPSSHNTQPWQFRLRGGALELCADWTRALPVVDPAVRELVISCGAALFNLRMALRHFGYAGDVALLPDPAEPDLLARIRLGPAHSPMPEEHQLFAAMPRRHTNRYPYEENPLPAWLLTALRAAASAERAALHVVESADARHAIAALVAEGDRRQYADRRFRRELATWVHSNRRPRRDGLPGYAFGMGDLLSYAGPLAIRAFDLGGRYAERDRGTVEESPVLAVLATNTDTVDDWLVAGQALQRVLLRATADGVSASFLNQPIEVPDLRPRLRATAGSDGAPQTLIRLGYARVVKPTPRRPTSEVLAEYLVDQWQDSPREGWRP